MSRPSYKTVIRLSLFPPSNKVFIKPNILLKYLLISLIQNT